MIALVRFPDAFACCGHFVVVVERWRVPTVPFFGERDDILKRPTLGDQLSRQFGQMVSPFAILANDVHLGWRLLWNGMQRRSVPCARHRGHWFESQTTTEVSQAEFLGRYSTGVAHCAVLFG